jgi:Zn-finger nucleic acid-binding protein
MQEIRVRSCDVKVDRCERCGGVWFDAGELEAVLSVAAKKLRVPPGAQCPSPLYRFQYPQTYVKIEMCTECGGLWLDAGEFTEIEAVRKALEKDGALDELAQPGGVKGALLNFVNTAIEALT